GIAEKAKIISGSSIQENDVIIGLASSGVHSNGYSLVRQVIKPYALDKQHGLSETLGEAVMRPTKIYAKQVSAVMDKVTIKCISQLTKDGLYDIYPLLMTECIKVEKEKSAKEDPEMY